MITDLPNFVSINKLADLPKGRYAVVESIYQQSNKPTQRAIMSEIVTLPESRTVGVDLQVVTEDRELRFRDFYLTASGAWRDSYGATARALFDLFPLVLAAFALTSRRGTIVEHDGQGRLTQAKGKGLNDGA